MVFRTVVCFFLYALAFTAESSSVLIVDGEPVTFIQTPYLSYRITHSKDTAWKPFEEKDQIMPSLLNFEGRFRFTCKQSNSIVFEWADNKIEYLDAIILNSLGDTCAHLTYNDENGYQSALFLKNQSLVLYHPKVNETYYVQYKLRSHNNAYVVPWVWDLQHFIVRFIKEYTWYGLLAGIIITVFCLNILFYVSQKESTFLWYALYTISLGVFHWSYIGVGFQWIWPQFTEWNRYSYMISSFLMLSFQYVYLYQYTKKLNPIPIRFIIGVIVFRFIILSFSLWHPYWSKWHLLLDFLMIVFQIWIMQKVFLYKTLHGRLYMASISLLGMFYLIFIASYYQFIPTTYFTYNAVAVGGIIELIIGMLALALRFKYLNDEKATLQTNEIESLKAIGQLKEMVLEETKEKERIQKEVNKELEIKIKERTIELAQQNEKLEELNTKLLDMSSQLDKQNWALNKELTGDRMKLMWGKEISFEEFKHTFPSDKHIFRFISDLKWHDEYICKKCGNKEWKEGSQYLSRKCTECKYEESVTANTLFHGVKFPLVKSLYISLYTVIHRDSLPIKQLAEEIDLREATVWAFRKKTLDWMNTKNHKGDVLKSFVDTAS